MVGFMAIVNLLFTLFCQQLPQHGVTLHTIYCEFYKFVDINFIPADLPIYPIFRYDPKSWHPFLKFHSP